jgi:acetylornithine/N-succinyldiaminopimelate aminotransferase
VDRAEIVAAARDHGLLITMAGDDVLRLCPPLIVGEAHLDEATERLDQALRSLR